ALPGPVWRPGGASFWQSISPTTGAAAVGYLATQPAPLAQCQPGRLLVVPGCRADSLPACGGLYAYTAPRTGRIDASRKMAGRFAIDAARAAALDPAAGALFLAAASGNENGHPYGGGSIRHALWRYAPGRFASPRSPGTQTSLSCPLRPG